MSTQPCGCDSEAHWTCKAHEVGTLGCTLGTGKSGPLAYPLAYPLDIPLPPSADPFIVKDSGSRQQFDSGMVRDVTTDKIDYSLALDGPMFERLAVHLTKGAKKYEARNWMKASGEAEAQRFRQSAVRHFIQWYRGDSDEDHAAAVFFNIGGYEYTKGRL